VPLPFLHKVIIIRIFSTNSKDNEMRFFAVYSPQLNLIETTFRITLALVITEIWLFSVKNYRKASTRFTICNFKLSQLNLLKTKRAMKERVLGTWKSVKEQRRTPKQYPLITDIFFYYTYLLFSQLIPQIKCPRFLHLTYLKW
jgi:hypothetical protein